MERSALIGGGAIVAALVGVAGFYMLLAGGPDDELPDYTRVKPNVEALRPASPVDTLGMKGSSAEPNVSKGTPGQKPAEFVNQRAEKDPEMAKIWMERRKKAIDTEEDTATTIVNRWLRSSRVPGKHHTTIRERVSEVYDAKRSLTEEAETGVITNRVARKRMANERDALRSDLAEYVEPAQIEALAEMFDKERVGAL